MRRRHGHTDNPTRRGIAPCLLFVALAEHVRRCHNKARDYESRDKGNDFFELTNKFATFFRMGMKKFAKGVF